MIKNITRIKRGITVNVGVSAKLQKGIIRAKNNIFGIVLDAVVKMADM